MTTSEEHDPPQQSSQNTNIPECRLAHPRRAVNLDYLAASNTTDVPLPALLSRLASSDMAIGDIVASIFTVVVIVAAATATTVTATTCAT